MTEIIVESGRAERQYWRDLWRYWELFYFLAWRDILVRYKQTVIGVVWGLIRPLLTMLVLTFIFGGSRKCRRGRAVSDPGVLWNAAVAILRHRVLGEQQQPRFQRRDDFQGLFPATGNSCLRRDHQFRELSDFRGADGFADD